MTDMGGQFKNRFAVSCGTQKDSFAGEKNLIKLCQHPLCIFRIGVPGNYNFKGGAKQKVKGGKQLCIGMRCLAQAGRKGADGFCGNFLQPQVAGQAGQAQVI